MSLILIVLLLNGSFERCLAFQSLEGRNGIQDGNVPSNLPGNFFGRNVMRVAGQGLRPRPLPSTIPDIPPRSQTLGNYDVTPPSYRIQIENVTENENESVTTETHEGNEKMRENDDFRVNEIVPVDLQVFLSVHPDTDLDLLTQEMERFLEVYLIEQYLRLAESQNEERKSTAPFVKLTRVDLTVLVVDFSSRRLLLNADSRISLRPKSLRTRKRCLQESTRTVTISIYGEVAYSVQVDGGPPTPEYVEKIWTDEFVEITAQPRLEEAILDAKLEGVVRVDHVSSRVNQTREETIVLASTETPMNSLEVLEEEKAPWQETTATTTRIGSASSELTRPSTLSIIFGFLLTGIATLGLVAYCYIFYKKRKKRLRKKKQMKETISIPAMSFAASSSTTNRNGAMTNSSLISSQPRSVSGSPSKPRVAAISMILSPVDETFSEDTSYKGIASSIVSEAEDVSDLFAKELQRAASLDQHAWDEFQKRKEAVDEIEAKAPGGAVRSIIGNTKSMPSSSLEKRDLSGDEKGIFNKPEIETDIEGKTSFPQSFPYGDELRGGVHGSGDDDDDWMENPLSPRSSRNQGGRKQWEPYTSALPPLPERVTGGEEKKDETSPTGFFAKELQNIEMDLARCRGPSADPTGSNDENRLEDVDISNNDMLSEVEELSKYVRRYERRKDRRTKREVEVNDRFSVGGASSAGASSMSIGMDGRVYKPLYSSTHLEPSTPPAASTISSHASSRGRSRESDNSSYAGRYLNAPRHDSIHHGNLSFVSDDEASQERDEDETNLRSQRLGISPFSVSQSDEDYSSPYSRGEQLNSKGVLAVSSQAPSSPDGYRQRIVYDNDSGSSNNGKNTESLVFSMSSVKSPTRLTRLRANDAIIDSSNSDVNTTYDPYYTRASLAQPPLGNSHSTASTRGGRSLMSFPSYDESSSGATSATHSSNNLLTRNTNQLNKKVNDRFDELRGMFEQRTSAQPAPIYPPGEHWQYEGHKKS